MTDEMLADGLMTVKEAASFLRLGISTIYEQMDAGRLGYCKVGRARRIPKRAVIELAKAAYVGPNMDGAGGKPGNLTRCLGPESVNQRALGT